MPDAAPPEPQDILTPITEDAVFLTACVDPAASTSATPLASPARRATSAVFARLIPEA
jgi:hypothetical protein